jgi:hypothetical protein
MAARSSSLSVPIGVEVELTTYLGQKYHGEVTAYDPGTKLLVIKSPSAGKSYDFRIVNLNFITDFRIVREAPAQQTSESVRLDIDSALQRARTNIAEKNFVASATPEGRSVYDAVRKTFECCWSGEDILVLEARIKPPYTLDSIEGPQTTVDYIKKILTKQVTPKSKS